MKMKKGMKPGDMISKMNEKKHKSGKKNWIAGAIKHPGALHRELGIKQGHKIPAGTLKSAAGKGGKLGARARLAETLKGFKHKKGSKNDHDADDKKTMKMCKTCGKKHMAGKHMKKKTEPGMDNSTAMMKCKMCGKKHAKGKHMKKYGKK